MKVIFVPPFQKGQEEVSIPQKDIHHIKNVLRKKPGDTILLSDGKSGYSGVISTINETELIVSNVQRNNSENTIQVTLAHSLIKAPNIELTVSKAVETGVSVYQPIISERSYMKSVDFMEKKKERLLRKIEESSKQCGRNCLMELSPPLPLKGFLEEDASPLKVFFEIEADKEFRDIVEENKEIESITILIGPEGGFSQSEIEAIKEAGFISTSLGRQLLRSETAAIVTSGLIQTFFQR